MDRTKTLKAFASYVGQYDSGDPKISLKIKHTYKVAELCEKIGAAIGLEGDDLDAAWLCGMLHDIGRFEQIRQYNTFMDWKSVDHAKLSTVVLFGPKRDADKILEALPLPCQLADFREFMDLKGYDDIVYTSVYYHSALQVPEELEERKKMYCNILRDADKLDIFRANLETSLEDIYNVTTEEIYNSEITPEVFQVFGEHRAVPKLLKKAPVDHLVGHICLTFELVYPVSRKLVKEQGYLKRIMAFESNNPKTRKQFEYMRQEMEKFL